MRVLVVASASPPHTLPLLPFGSALRNAGHDVRVAVTPALVPTVLSAGLLAVSVGRDVDFMEDTRQQMELTRDAKLTSEIWQSLRRGKGPKALRIFLSVAEAMIDDTIAFARAWRPQLIVHGPTTYAGAVTAAVLGVPNVRVPMIPDIAYRAQEMEKEMLAPLSERFGGGPVDPLSKLTLDTCPPSIQVDADYPRQRVRYIPYNGTGVVPDWLLAPKQRRRVAVTWGTSLAKINPNLVLAGPVLRSIADIDAELVVTIPPAHRPLLGELPDFVRVVEELPLHVLLSTCDAIVHQGGNGTMMTSVACGMPQLIVPQFPDQAFGAKFLTEAGAARTLFPEDAAPGVALGLLEELLVPEGPAALAAAKLRAEVESAPAPTQIVEVLERLV